MQKYVELRQLFNIFLSILQTEKYSYVPALFINVKNKSDTETLMHEISFMQYLFSASAEAMATLMNT